MLLPLLLATCQRQQGGESAANTIEVSDQQIHALAMERGRLIADASQQALASHLKNAIQKEGILTAFQFCHVQAMPLTDSLSQTYDAKIKRATLWVRNPADKADAVERKILKAYHQQI